MQVLTDEEKQLFMAAADKCVAEVKAAGASDEEPFEDDSGNADEFIEMVAGLLEKYDGLGGIRYRDKTFVAEFSEDEDGAFITGIRWIEDETLEVLS